MFVLRWRGGAHAGVDNETGATSLFQEGIGGRLSGNRRLVLSKVARDQRGVVYGLRRAPGGGGDKSIDLALMCSVSLARFTSRVSSLCSSRGSG